MCLYFNNKLNPIFQHNLRNSIQKTMLLRFFRCFYATKAILGPFRSTPRKYTNEKTLVREVWFISGLGTAGTFLPLFPHWLVIAKMKRLDKVTKITVVNSFCKLRLTKHNKDVNTTFYFFVYLAISVINLLIDTFIYILQCFVIVWIIHYEYWYLFHWVSKTCGNFYFLL